MLNFLRKKPFKCFTNEYGNMRVASRSYRGVQPVKLDNIVGTVGRCHPDGTWEKFKKTFTTRQIERKMDKLHSMPPMKVYKVGCKYFIVDGHHRTAAAMEVGKEFFDAEVYEYKFSGKKKEPDYGECPAKEFKQATGLTGIILSGREEFEKLKRHISHMNKNVSLKNAARFWYENIFLPYLRSRGNKNIYLTESEYYFREKIEGEDDQSDENPLDSG
ncbi:MAG: hypothetical protein ACOCQB_01695 [Halanaerobiaceae bacterium]